MGVMRSLNSLQILPQYVQLPGFKFRYLHAAPTLRSGTQCGVHEHRHRPFVEGVWDGLGAPALLGDPPPQQVGWFASRSPRFTKVGFKTISEDHQIRGLSVSQFSLTIPAYG